MKHFVYLLLSTLLVIGLSACSNSAKEVDFPAMPKELADCKIYYLTNDDGDRIYITRCPDSSTSTQFKQGKQTLNSAVVEEPSRGAF